MSHLNEPPLNDFQTKIAEFVFRKIQSGEKRLLIQLPVGVGKSRIITEIIYKLLVVSYSNSINLIIPPALMSQFNLRLKGSRSLSTFPLHYEYSRGMISLRDISIQSYTRPPVSFVDDVTGATLRRILQQNEVTVAGFYPEFTAGKSAKQYEKSKPDYILLPEVVFDSTQVKKTVRTATDIVKSILTKLSLPVVTEMNLEKSLLGLDAWVDEFLVQNNVEVDENKVALMHTVIARKEALNEFDKLLHDDPYFKSVQAHGKEKVWQDFFEKNKWIFGLNLNLVFLTSLDKKKYEQVVAGFVVNSNGKRIDGLLKSNGLMSSFHFCEIKTHTTKILSDAPYRANCYSISTEFAGAVAQTQKTVLKAMQDIRHKLVLTDNEGFETNEIVYNYLPQATIVIGSLNEFYKGKQRNEEKYPSFELFRKSLTNIQVITFDELYARARAVLGVAQQEL